jgi:hypothetical protein
MKSLMENKGEIIIYQTLEGKSEFWVFQKIKWR